MSNENTSEEQTITGVVEDVVYYNDDNGYAVCYVQTQNEYITVVGYMPCIAEGESVSVNGSWTFHAEYGAQFKANYYEKNMPKEKAEILKYLSSGVIKGVRRATAEKIVDYFGEHSLDIISKSPHDLSKIAGISKNKAIEIGKSYSEQLGVRDIVIFLQKYGVSPNYAVKVYKRYGTSAVNVIKNNPYVLAEEVYGIGFKTADKIAMSLGIKENSVTRIEAAISFGLWESAMNGHTYLPRKTLAQNICNLINVDMGEVDNAINSMIFSDKLANENYPNLEVIYQPAMFFAEVYVAKRLLNISNVTFIQNDMNVDKLIEQVEKEQNITLASQQKQAVYGALQNGAMVITGGPGTGKTTIINAIIKVMEHLGKDILLAAPTGRAAKRMTDMCGIESKTIHRLLEVGFSEEEDGMHFSRNEDNPLNCDILIVDEMSMVDTILMNSLLKAVKSGTRLIMVGDSDQLPSVGAGDVLRDIIASGSINVVQLTEIFRQAKESMIVVNAHQINHGEYPILNKKDSDFFIVQRDNAQDIVNSIVDLCKNRLPNTYGYDPKVQIQVLTPTRKGITGVNTLNEKLQAALNPPSHKKKEKQFKNILFREGDKVMQLKNNYTIVWKKIDGDLDGVGVFNGDVGFIDSIDYTDESVKIIFDDRVSIYDFSQLDEIDLAYAVTVHKSQGSEFETIIMPMYPCAPMLQNRNLLYTAVTRAKKLVVLVGRESVIRAMVDNISEQKRYSGLQNKLRLEL